MRLIQKEMQPNQFAIAIDHVGSITNFTQYCAGKFLFFSRLEGDLFLNVCVIRKGTIRKTFHL